MNNKWKLLAEYLADEAGGKENEEIRNWIRRKNIKSYEELKMNWNKTEKEDGLKINTDKAWNNLYNRILEEEESGASEKPTIPLQRRILRYAALILVIIGLGTGAFFAYQEINSSADTVKVDTPANKQNEKVLLPDGSVAYLNYNSELKYPKQFKKNQRAVNINGEVFFDVDANPERPFVITAKNAQIEVLGTSFNVNTRLPGDKVEVLVKSGKVKLYRKNNKNSYIIVEQGFKGIAGKETLQKIKNNDRNYLAWTTGRLIFKGQKLIIVAQTLMRTYNVEINIKNPEIREYKLTTSFTDESIDRVMEVIATTFSVDVDKINDHKYVIKKYQR
jgi:ferric-dicitrate binding protein FerR (iron transport regulator)